MNRVWSALIYVISCMGVVQVHAHEDVDPWIYQSFDESMKLREHASAIVRTEQIVGIDGVQLYRFFRKLYNRMNHSFLQAQGLVLEEKIPKIIHQIWISGDGNGSQLPEAFEQLCESWRYYHAANGWMYKLWTDEDVKKLQLYNQQFYDATDNPGMRSDMLRWELLYRFGGFYLDVDFECLKPLDSLLCYDFVTALQPLDTFFVQLGAAFLGSRPGHPIMKHCIETIKDDWQLKGAPKKTGPVHFTKSFYQMADKDENLDIALPSSYWYPLGSQEKEFDYDRWVQEGAYGIHHWAKSWMPPRFRLRQFKQLDNDACTESWND